MTNQIKLVKHSWVNEYPSYTLEYGVGQSNRRLYYDTEEVGKHFVLMGGLRGRDNIFAVAHNSEEADRKLHGRALKKGKEIAHENGLELVEVSRDRYGDNEEQIEEETKKKIGLSGVVRLREVCFSEGNKKYHLILEPNQSNIDGDDSHIENGEIEIPLSENDYNIIKKQICSDSGRLAFSGELELLFK